MRTPLLTPGLVLMAFLTGCANLQPAIPEGYTGPKATVRDSGMPVAGNLAHVFTVSQVDGRSIRNSRGATLSANYGRGFSITPTVIARDVPAGSLKLTLSGQTMYAAPILAMMNPTCTVEGVVEVFIEKDTPYIVKGLLDQNACSVWLEEDRESGKIVGTKITGPGVK
ncbi:MAG: hypothetical protein HYX42_07100 [Polaromonas sp.]|uniref:hypothetical protein n=1 Tax=Polaromonas sp. TaxID=1869339 RepID=UPI0025DDA01D|nr:hypothetical protein [Polaromonas sp.]MBI2726001.1 hypothetical protein [Polaromonas sp.]